GAGKGANPVPKHAGRPTRDPGHRRAPDPAASSFPRELLYRPTLAHDDDRLSSYAFALPPELIATRPLEDRASSRLLHVPKGESAFVHRRFRDLPSLLAPGDALVL